MPSDSTKVPYVAGFGQSESTLLGDILGQVNGFVSVGETRGIRDNGRILDKLCSCGAPFPHKT